MATPRRSLRLASVLLLALGACSSGMDEPPTTLRVLMTEDWVTAPFLGAVRDFELAHPKVRVVVDKGPIRLQTDAVRAGISSGAPPDVVQGHAFSAASQGLAQPLDDLWEENLDPAEFFPGAIDDVRWNGRTYGVPLDTNAMVLMYNADHFRQAGLTLPDPFTQMSLEEFATLAEALTLPDGSRRALAIPDSGWWTYGWIRANGGEIVAVGEDGQAQVTLDAPAVVGAMSFLADLVSRGLAFPPEGADTHSLDALALFRTGATSMHTSGSWDIASLRKDPQPISYGITLMPAAPGGGTALGGSSTWVPKGSPNRELAFSFMTHLASDRYALAFAKEEGRLPVRLRVFDDPFFDDPELEVFLRQLKTADPAKITAFPAAAADYAVAMDSILTVGGRDAGEVLREAQLRAQASLAATATAVGALTPG